MGRTDQYESEYRILHGTEKKYHWVHARGTVTKTPQGKVTHISGSMLDITARKEAESDFKRAESDFKRAESHFKRLVDVDQNMIFVKDREGGFLFMNHALEKLYGTTLAKARGKTDRDFCKIPEQVERFRQHDQLVFEGKRF